jgi:hypothetical protein
MQTKNEIIEILEELKIQNYIINDDLTVDVNGNVNIAYMRLTKIPIKFGTINGFFYCDNNQLITLTGAPIEVHGDFNCYNNKLTSLKNSPNIINGDFYCSCNLLLSLEYIPNKIYGNFGCSDNKLISLEDGPNEVYGNFDCSYNKLISLKGIPKIIKGKFLWINNNEKLESLEPLDLIINKDIIINNQNTKITEEYIKDYKNKQYNKKFKITKSLFKKL